VVDDGTASCLFDWSLSIEFENVRAAIDSLGYDDTFCKIA
jgi:hypothetical protein